MSMKKRMLFAFNPKAGRSVIKEYLLEIVETFVAADYDVTIRTTQYAGELPNIIKEQAPGFDLLVTSGGDGTLNETVNGLMENNLSIPFGFIPAGTVNDFATTLRLSKNMPQAARDIVNGVVFPCDACVFQDRYFSYVAAFGSFTEVSYETPQAYKNLLGKVAYALDAIGRVPSIRSHRMRLEFDGQVIEDDYLFGMVSNSISVGGMPLNSNREVWMNDGILEVMLIKKPTLPFNIRDAADSIRTLEINSPFLTTFKVKEVTVTNLDEEDVPWALDGEYGGCDRVVKVGVRKQALNIMVSRQPDVAVPQQWLDITTDADDTEKGVQE